MRSRAGCLEIIPWREWGSILAVLLLLLLLAGLLSRVDLEASRHRVCTHAPHLGSCKIEDMVMLYDAGTKTMQPSWFTCGCTSDHGVRIRSAE